MSTYIKLSTLEYPRHIGDIELDPAGMQDYALVEWVDPPQIDETRERMSIGIPVKVDNKWLTTWSIVAIPDQEHAIKVREKRNKLLAESDWTQVADSPVDRPTWTAYRQQLRDISAQPGFPWDIIWPTTP